MFGAMASGQAAQFGPDVGKAVKAALKVFTYIDIKGKIDPIEIPAERMPCEATKFKGEIEFKNVWFRYPTRKTEWVFKGLNIKIEQNQSVAIVGESGCGKSTFVNLVLRFYDPQFGQVLIDGVDVKLYNIKQLRERMGLVMQEPTLFNYTVKENILYGKENGKDSDIIKAATISNCTEFIDSGELQ
jgi:ATP-binding cassette subfamily B (MDR/TAP) protein 1